LKRPYRKARSIRNVIRIAIFVCALCVNLGFATTPAQAHGHLLAWAESGQAHYLGPNAKPFMMGIEDRFPRRLAAGGVKAETACSGSRWVYDYVHHIAAVEDGGPEALLYLGDPPERLPARDLSRVVTARGVRLGESPLQVTTALSVSRSDVVRTSTHRQFLYLEKTVYIKGQTHDFADIARIIFSDGRAVSIWLAHNEP
jgi:hypothetical protein